KKDSGTNALPVQTPVKVVTCFQFKGQQQVMGYFNGRSMWQQEFIDSDSLELFTDASVAVSTWSTYVRAWNEWFKFNQSNNKDPFGEDKESAIQFTLVSMQKGFSKSKLACSLAGVDFFRKLCECKPIKQYFIVNQLVRGYRRASRVRDNRKPISFKVLSQLFVVLEEVCYSEYEVVLIRCSFIIAFFAALRISELVAKNQEDQGLKNWSGNRSSKFMDVIRIFWKGI
ncbi:Hypothetical predicted protein, partial [Pelobates cultripes]